MWPPHAFCASTFVTVSAAAGTDRVAPITVTDMKATKGIVLRMYSSPDVTKAKVAYSRNFA
jgi:hypothetical protein